MKIFIIIATIVVGFFVLGQRQCSRNLSSPIPEEVKVIQKTPTLTPETPELITPPPAEVANNPGWDNVGVESGYTMYTPDSSTTKETEWISIENWNTTFSLKDCIMQFKKKDGTVVSFKYDSATTEKYLEMSPGVFATSKWTEYVKTGMNSTAVKFRQDGNKPLVVTVGRRKLAN